MATASRTPPPAVSTPPYTSTTPPPATKHPATTKNDEIPYRCMRLYLSSVGCSTRGNATDLRNRLVEHSLATRFSMVPTDVREQYAEYLAKNRARSQTVKKSKAEAVEAVAAEAANTSSDDPGNQSEQRKEPVTAQNQDAPEHGHTGPHSPQPLVQAAGDSADTSTDGHDENSPQDDVIPEPCLKIFLSMMGYPARGTIDELRDCLEASQLPRSYSGLPPVVRRRYEKYLERTRKQAGGRNGSWSTEESLDNVEGAKGVKFDGKLGPKSSGKSAKGTVDSSRKSRKTAEAALQEMGTGVPVPLTALNKPYISRRATPRVAGSTTADKSPQRRRGSEPDQSGPAAVAQPGDPVPVAPQTDVTDQSSPADPPVQSSPNKDLSWERLSTRRDCLVASFSILRRTYDGLAILGDDKELKRMRDEFGQNMRKKARLLLENEREMDACLDDGK